MRALCNPHIPGTSKLDNNTSLHFKSLGEVKKFVKTESWENSIERSKENLVKQKGKYLNDDVHTEHDPMIH